MKKVALTCFSLLFAAITMAQVSIQEKNILLELYSATNGTSWNNKWIIEEPVKNWHGITVENNKVIGINLLFNNLNGTLPASLGDLKNLKNLELSFNPITGNLPSELGKLEQLEILAVNGTNVNGNIPESFGNLKNLKQLHLSSNKLSGIIPESLGNLKEIEVFNIFDNDLFGALPHGLATCYKLKELMVAENNISSADNFSVILLANSGSNLNFKETSILQPVKSIIAIEQEEED